MSEKLELVTGAMKLAEFFGEKSFQDLIGMYIFLHPEKKDAWNELVRDVIKFQEAPFEERAKMMGLQVTYKK